MRFAFRFLGLLPLLWFTLSHAGIPDVAKSVVRIQTASQNPDYRVPWYAGQVSGGVGAGFVIGGNRIMTNAHVVSNARFLAVLKEGDPNSYPARVLHIAHDCDLALLEVIDPKFFKGTAPLDFGGIPELESTVNVYGYPIGGDRLSVTRGIVSRIDFQTYSHSGLDAHLTIQIDAAINPGNSGGPVLQDGKVVGVAFQGYSGDIAQNVGYMIPTPVVKRFLTDVEDGSYDRYVDLGLSYQPLINPAARRALGIGDRDIGVFVSTVYGQGSADGIVLPGDVIVSIDGLSIASDGTVRLDGEQMEMAEVVERKFKNDTVKLEILRNKQPLTVDLSLKNWPFPLQANAYDEKPRFVVFGGLVFQPADQNFMRAHKPEDLRLRYLFDHFIADHVYRERPELVVLSNILPDPVNAYAQDFRYSLVDEINEKPIKTLADVAAAFAEDSEFYVIKLVGQDRPIVLEKKAVDAARERILSRYNVFAEQNLTK